MQEMTLKAGWIVLAALAIPAVAQAEGGKLGRDCRGARFSTCASVSIGMRGHRVAVDVARPFRGERPDNRGRSEEMRPWEGRPGFVPLGVLGEGRGEEGPAPCPARDREAGACEAATVVTPEPVSMTLLATGLAGMAGAGAVRRRMRRSNG
jgi:MYXO-CTERM domain-containing protein